MSSEHLSNVRRLRPVVHTITNYVTANDCANLLLAAGASPIMADAPEEASQIAAIADAVVLNLGTLNSYRREAIRIAGKTAHTAGKPVVMDPVGVGASDFRRDAAQMLLNGNVQGFQQYLGLAQQYGGYRQMPLGYQDAMRCIQMQGNVKGSPYASYVKRMMAERRGK